MHKILCFTQSLKYVCNLVACIKNISVLVKKLNGSYKTHAYILEQSGSDLFVLLPGLVMIGCR